MQANFDETLSSPGGMTRTRKGTVYFRKVGRMRWEFAAPSEGTVVSDGTTVYDYEKDLNQVVELPVNKALKSSATAFLLGLGNIRRDFKVSLPPVSSSDGLTHVILTPKGGGDTMELGLDPKSYDIVNFKLTNQVGGVTELKFSDIRTNVALDDSLFSVHSARRRGHRSSPKELKFASSRGDPDCARLAGRVSIYALFYPVMEAVHLISLGCPKNTADSELMLGALVRAGFEVTMDPQQAQVLLVNTCAFIEPAKKESIDAILAAAEVKKNGAGKRLVVAGCLSQRYGSELREQFPEVDIFVGTGNFLDLPELLRRSERPELRPIPYTGAAHLLPAAEAPRVRTGDPFSAYLKVSEGCDHRCAFCIIPKIRGRHESRAAR